MHAAELKDVSVKYGTVKALDNVSLHLEEGEALALLGPNGAGKTTAIGLLTGTKRVPSHTSSGKAILHGRNPRLPKSRLQMGATPQEASFPLHMKVGEILDFTQAHFKNPIPRDEIIEGFGLSDKLSRVATQMSGGQQRNLAVALAFCGNPRAVFLDEPTTGLDLEARARIWAYVRAYRDGGGALLLTTHYIEEAEAIADRVILLNEGRIAEEGTVADILARVNVRMLKFNASAQPNLSSAKIESVDGNRYAYLSSDADATVRELVTSKIEFSNLEVLPASLEAAIETHWRKPDQGGKS